jgi:uncharacterized protein (TIGR02001 family)
MSILSTRKSLLSIALGCAFAVAAPAFAQTAAPAPAPAPDFTVSGNIGVVSSYVFRGLNQTDYKPAVQGGFDFSHSSGVYAGVWASNVKWLKDFNLSSGKVETDIYLGFKNTVGDFTYDVGFLRYEYSGSVTPGAPNPDTNEIYLGGSYKMFTLKYSHAISDAFGNLDSKGSYYLDLSASFPVVDNVTLNLHAGYQAIKGPTKDDASYADGKIEGVYDFGNGLTAAAGVTFTDAEKGYYTPGPKKFIGKTTPYLMLKYSKTF